LNWAREKKISIGRNAIEGADALIITDGKNHIEPVKELIIEYIRRLGRDLTFQNIDEELKNLAERYTPPNGKLLIALEDAEVLGMIAYHKYSETCCEMKRLYVRPAYRGRKIGEKLIEELIRRAKQAGYQEMILDTIVPLQSAIYLYKKFGFTECEAYYCNPMPDVLYFRKKL